MMTPFHLADYSPWPILASLSALFLTFGSVLYFHQKGGMLALVGFLLCVTVSILWWSDVVSENLAGFHKSIVSQGFRIGMILFMLSEILFFFSFFWAYFHNCWGPQSELGYMWPPYGFEGMIVDPFSIPLLNTVVLLSSGASITWSHHSLLNQDKTSALVSLLMTVMLGMYFLFLQGSEYANSDISINSMVYGSVFFLLTGFHGLHVTIGTIFLMVCLVRMKVNHFSVNRHVGFEAAAWYWHFVDVVWLFLYFFLYWYGFSC